MPRNFINYENTIFYKLMCKNPPVKDIYIDYTTDITRRKYFHKIKAINPINNKYKLYDFINTHGGFDNFDIIEIEKIPCDDSSEAKRIKYDFIKSLNSTLNGNICNPMKIMNKNMKNIMNIE